MVSSISNYCCPEPPPEPNFAGLYYLRHNTRRLTAASWISGLWCGVVTTAGLAGSPLNILLGIYPALFTGLGYMCSDQNAATADNFVRAILERDIIILDRNGNPVPIDILGENPTRVEVIALAEKIAQAQQGRLLARSVPDPMSMER